MRCKVQSSTPALSFSTKEVEVNGTLQVGMKGKESRSQRQSQSQSQSEALGSAEQNAEQAIQMQVQLLQIEGRAASQQRHVSSRRCATASGLLQLAACQQGKAREEKRREEKRSTGLQRQEMQGNARLVCPPAAHTDDFFQFQAAPLRACKRKHPQQQLPRHVKLNGMEWNGMEENIKWKKMEWNGNGME